MWGCVGHGKDFRVCPKWICETSEGSQVGEWQNVPLAAPWGMDYEVARIAVRLIRVTSSPGERRALGNEEKWMHSRYILEAS